VVGEKGALWVSSWKQDGGYEKQEDASLKLPQDFRIAMEQLTEEFSKSMFFDTTKTVILTAEMVDGYSLSEFAKDQKDFMKRLDKLIIEYGLENTVRVDAMRISTDVEPVTAGKGLGAKQTLRILEGRGYGVDTWIVVGDSPSDYVAPEYMAKQKIPVLFVYVGDTNDFKGKLPLFPIERTKGICDEGTSRYLEDFLKKEMSLTASVRK
jgi:hypothetical protein